MEEDTRGVVRLGMPYARRPERIDLERFLTDYCGYWRSTGLQLGLQSPVLDQVEVDYHTQRERFRVTLDRWLQVNVRVTWGNLELAITNAIRTSLGYEPLTTIPTTQPDLADIQSSTQLRQGDNNIQQETDNGISHHKPVVSNKPTLIANPRIAIAEFASTVSRIEGILMISNEVEDNLNAIKSVCGYLPITVDSNKPMFTMEQLKEIDACSNVRDVFRQLRFHLRWDDHLILTAILDRLGHKECEELLRKFESKIYCQIKLQEIYEENKKLEYEIPNGFENMVAIINKKYWEITKEEYDQLKCFIAKHCGVETFVLSPFLHMSSSSLILNWLVPSIAITHMVEIATKNKHMFIKESFIFLQIAKTVVLDIENKDNSQHKWKRAEFHSWSHRKEQKHPKEVPLKYNKDDSQDKSKKQEAHSRSFLEEQGHREEVPFKDISQEKLKKQERYNRETPLKGQEHLPYKVSWYQGLSSVQIPLFYEMDATQVSTELEDLAVEMEKMKIEAHRHVGITIAQERDMIISALQENDITVNSTDHKNLKYFTVKAEALFRCDKCGRTWSSHMATIVVDLYNCRVNRFNCRQRCKRCTESWAWPRFTEDRFKEIMDRVITYFTVNVYKNVTLMIFSGEDLECKQASYI